MDPQEASRSPWMRTIPDASRRLQIRVDSLCALQAMLEAPKDNLLALLICRLQFFERNHRYWVCYGLLVCFLNLSFVWHAETYLHTLTWKICFITVCMHCSCTQCGVSGREIWACCSENFGWGEWAANQDVPVHPPENNQGFRFPLTKLSCQWERFINGGNAICECCQRRQSMLRQTRCVVFLVADFGGPMTEVALTSCWWIQCSHISSYNYTLW